MIVLDVIILRSELEILIKEGKVTFWDSEDQITLSVQEGD